MPTKKILTKKEALDLFNGLNGVGHLKGVKFSYAVAKNMNTLKPEIVALQKALEPSKEFFEYEEERIKLAESFAVKVDGVPQKTLENGRETFVITDKDKFETALSTIKEKYKKVMTEREAQVKAFDSLLEEKITLELVQVSQKELPKDITPLQLSAIFVMVI